MERITQYSFFNKLKALDFVDEIWLFGSRARGDNQSRSDIDIAVICPNATDNDWLKVVDIIEESDTLLKIDCIRLDGSKLSKEFYNNIVRDKKVLYMKENLKDTFSTLNNALDRLKEVMGEKDIEQNPYKRDSALKRFEFTIELFWKLLKKILHHEKIEAYSPRNTLSLAYQYRLIDDEKIWLTMLDDRNNATHAYKEEMAKEIFERIKLYVPVFEASFITLQKKYFVQDK